MINIFGSSFREERDTMARQLRMQVKMHEETTAELQRATMMVNSMVAAKEDKKAKRRRPKIDSKDRVSQPFLY